MRRLDHAKDKDTYTHASSCQIPRRSTGLEKGVGQAEIGDGPENWI